jgi:hypothetical protein
VNDNSGRIRGERKYQIGLRYHLCVKLESLRRTRKSFTVPVILIFTMRVGRCDTNACHLFGLLVQHFTSGNRLFHSHTFDVPYNSYTRRNLKWRLHGTQTDLYITTACDTQPVNNLQTNNPQRNCFPDSNAYALYTAGH